MGIDEDAIAFRKWQPSVEARLAALETRPVGVGASANVADMSANISDVTTALNSLITRVGGLEAEIVTLKAQVTDLEPRLIAVEAKATESSTVLAGVEAALGSHGHPP